MERIGRRQARAAIAAVLAVVSAIALTGPAGAAPAFGSPVRIGGASGYELGIEVAPDGTIFVDDPGGPILHGSLFRSTDGGANFARVAFQSPYSRFPGGFDAESVTAPGGRVYFLDLWIGSNSVAASMDNGVTWTRGSPITTLPLSDRQWIAVGKRDPSTGLDTIYIVYALINPPSWAMFARSRDGGQTWDFHRPVPGMTGGATGFTGSLVADGDFVAFSYEQGGKLLVATSPDAGESWTTQQTTMLTNARDDITAAALDGQSIYSAYVERASGSVNVVRSQDRGATWPNLLPTTISEGGTAVFPWIAARGGKVAAAWYASDAPTGDADRVPPSARWTVKYAESLDGGVTWTDPVAVTGTVKTGIICTQGISCTSGRELGDFLALTIDAAGKSMIVYGDFFCGDGGGCGGLFVKQL